MLTIFTLPRRWEGEFLVIQRNAVRSWQQLAEEIILLGDEPGTAAAAKDLGVRHVPEITRNALGAPLVPSVFSQGELCATRKLLAYVNTDLLLFPCFRRAVETVYGYFRSRRFLLIGGRWNVVVNKEITFPAPGLESELRAAGTEYSPAGMDYFVYPRGLYDSIPNFAVGRMYWDNWLARSAEDRGVPVVDATVDVFAVHQFHGNDPPLPRRGNYAGIGAKVGPEVEENLRLYKTHGGERRFLCNNTAYQLAEGSVRRRMIPPL